MRQKLFFALPAFVGKFVDELVRFEADERGNTLDFVRGERCLKFNAAYAAAKAL